MFSFQQRHYKNDSQYWFIGVHISSSMRKLETALIGVDRLNSGSSLTLQKSVSYDLPKEITTTYRELLNEIQNETEQSFFSSLNKEDSEKERPFFLQPSVSNRSKQKRFNRHDLSKLISLREMVTTVQEEAIIELLSGTKVKQEEIIATAINGPIIWIASSGFDFKKAHYSVSNGKLLAERTGLNIIDSFTPSEWSPSSHDNHFLSLPYWIILASSTKHRLFLDLGETARWTYIPSTSNSSTWSNVTTSEVGPCGSFLNLMTQHITKDGSLIDIGGKLSVQGNCSADLLHYWYESRKLAGTYKEISPRYYQEPNIKVFNEIFYFDALKSSLRKYASLDALCTSVHWIAEEIKANLDNNVNLHTDDFELVLTGGAKQNGLLFTRVKAHLAPTSILNLSDLGLPEDSFDAVALATLGALFAASIPATFTVSTAGKIPQLLGKISPGRPESWKLFLEFATNKLNRRIII